MTPVALSSSPSTRLLNSAQFVTSSPNTPNTRFGHQHHSEPKFSGAAVIPLNPSMMDKLLQMLNEALQAIKGNNIKIFPKTFQDFFQQAGKTITDLVAHQNTKNALGLVTTGVAMALTTFIVAEKGLTRTVPLLGFKGVIPVFLAYVGLEGVQFLRAKHQLNDFSNLDEKSLVQEVDSGLKTLVKHDLVNGFFTHNILPAVKFAHKVPFINRLLPEKLLKESDDVLTAQLMEHFSENWVGQNVRKLNGFKEGFNNHELAQELKPAQFKLGKGLAEAKSSKDILPIICNGIKDILHESVIVGWLKRLPFYAKTPQEFLMNLLPFKNMKLFQLFFRLFKK